MLTHDPTPEQAVERLVAEGQRVLNPTEDILIDNLAAAGVHGQHADLAYKFTQLACGRALLSDAGCSFSNEYYLLNRDGNVVDQGNIDQSPYFTTAIGLASPTAMGETLFKFFALTSSEVHSINDLLN